MTYRFDTKIARSPDELAFYLFRHAIDNLGWTAAYAGGGTGSGVAGTADIFATREDWRATNNCYQVIREPQPGKRALTFQRGINNTQMAVYVGWTAGTAESPLSGTETSRPTFTVERQIVGTGGSVKSSFVDVGDAFQVLLFGDDTPGGDYIAGTDPATDVNGAAHLLGFVAKPLARQNTTGDRIFGMFPMNTFRGVDEDPCMYIEAWTGQFASTTDFYGWYQRTTGSENWIDGTAGNLISPFYWRGTAAEAPGPNTSPFHAAQARTRFFPMTVGRRTGTSPFFCKGVMQDMKWAYLEGNTGIAGYGASITIPSFTKGRIATPYVNQDFIRVADDLFIPWDLTNYPLPL